MGTKITKITKITTKVTAKHTKKMRIQLSSRKTLHNLLNKLRTSGERFITEDTSGSFKIRVRKKSSGFNQEIIYEYNSPGDFRAMGVYMKLKKDIMSRKKLLLKKITPRDLKYWLIQDEGFNNNSKTKNKGGTGRSSNNRVGHLGAKDVLNRVINRVINIDIKKAYPYAFYNMGLISSNTLKYMLDLDASGHKIARLKGMGILAKRKLINKYSSGKHRAFEIQDNEYLRACFFNACKIIDDIMLKCCKIAGKHLLFYWVDGIYVNSEAKSAKRAISRINALIKKSGYKYSQETLRDFRYGLESGEEGDNNKAIMAISFRKRSSKINKITGRRRWGKKPKTFTLPLNTGLVNRID